MSEMLALQAAAFATAPRPLTIAEARKHFARLGMSLRKTEFGEFRVNYRHGEEATAAYESDLPAAIETGLAMLAHKARVERSAARVGISPAVAALAVMGAF